MTLTIYDKYKYDFITPLFVYVVYYINPFFSRVYHYYWFILYCSIRIARIDFFFFPLLSGSAKAIENVIQKLALDLIDFVILFVFVNRNNNME